jgi:hypothetical protein
MAFRKFIVANLYIITITWFIVGFGWMFTIAFLPNSFGQVLPSFFFTVAGNILLWAAYHFSNSESKPREPRRQKERKVVEEPRREERHQVITPSTR